MAVLEDQLGHAERGAGGQQVGEHADGGDHRRLQGDQQKREPERQHDADHQRRLPGQRALEVVVLGDGAADQRALRQVGAQAVDRRADRRVRRVLLGDRLDDRQSAAARLRGQHLRDAGIAPARPRRRAAASPAGATSCSGPGGAGPNAALHLLVALARPVAARHDLDRRHARVELQHRQRQRAQRRRSRSARRPPGAATGARPRRRSAGSGARRRAPTSGRACRPGRPAARARRAAGSASRRGRRGPRA